MLGGMTHTQTTPRHITVRAYPSLPDMESVTSIGRHWYIDGPLPERTYERNAILQQARARALLSRAGSQWVAVGQTAALIWGLPQACPRLDIEIARHKGKPNHASTFGDPRTDLPFSRIRRRNLPYPEDAITTVDGVRVLKLPYVILEILRDADPLNAVIGAEAAVARVLTPDYRRRIETLTAWADLSEWLVGQLDRRPRAPQVARARDRLRIVGPFSQSAAESLAKCRLWQCGVDTLQQQIRWRWEGRDAFLDFANYELGVALEVDGKNKYAGPDGADKLWAEKTREDALRRDFPRFIRVGWSELWNDRAGTHMASLLPREILGTPRTLR